MTVEFILKSFTSQNILHASRVLKSIFNASQIQSFHYPTRIQKLTVLSSPHVHKKSREQFETRTHKMALKATELDHSQIDKTIQLVQQFELIGVQLQLRVIDHSVLHHSLKHSYANLRLAESI